MMMMIPEAYAGRDDLPEELRGFYAFHGCLTEPWDGPASISFTDGTRDRRDARPQRPAPGPLDTRRRTAGSCSPPRPACSTSRRRTSCARAGCSPGNLFLVDLDRGPDRRGRRDQARDREPPALRRLVRARGSCNLAELPERPPRVPRAEPLRSRQLAFGYTQEDMKVILTPAREERRGADRLDGQRLGARGALGSAPAPLLLLQAALRAGHEPADRLDARGGRDERRDERRLRAEPARRDAGARAAARDRPADPPRQASSSRFARSTRSIFKAHTIDITWPVAEGTAGLDAALDRDLARGRRGPRRRRRTSSSSPTANVGPDRVAIPSLLAVSSVHHHLVREGTRLQAGLVIESGEPRDVHQFATLIGYGAAAVNPYVMLETLARARRAGLAPGGDDGRHGAEAGDQGDQARAC